MKSLVWLDPIEKSGNTKEKYIAHLVKTAIKAQTLHRGVKTSQTAARAVYGMPVPPESRPPDLIGHPLTLIVRFSKSAGGKLELMEAVLRNHLTKESKRLFAPLHQKETVTGGFDFSKEELEFLDSKKSRPSSFAVAALIAKPIEMTKSEFMASVKINDGPTALHALIHHAADLTAENAPVRLTGQEAKVFALMHLEGIALDALAKYGKVLRAEDAPIRLTESEIKEITKTRLGVTILRLFAEHGESLIARASRQTLLWNALSPNGGEWLEKLLSEKLP